MNKTELITAVAEKAGLTKKDVEKQRRPVISAAPSLTSGSPGI